MKLFYSETSPFVRKVMVLIHEAAISGITLEPVAGHAVEPGTMPVDQNPLGKIPTLVTDDGQVIFDSRVICQWLDAQHGGARLYPEAPARWDVLRREALADGLLDAALLARYENALRPEALRWADWTRGQMGKIDAALDEMERDCASFAGVDAGTIATACALGYLDFRFPDLDWRRARPQLAAWFREFSGRESMRASEPVG